MHRAELTRGSLIRGLAGVARSMDRGGDGDSELSKIFGHDRVDGHGYWNSRRKVVLFVVGGE